MTYLSIAGLLGLGATALTSAALATAAAPAPAADATKGKAVFARCSVCHKIDKTAPGGIGPNLAGVHGRKAGQLPGYSYSSAMKASGLTWNDATLSRYLSGPTKVVPGTKMLAPPVTNEQDRKDLIAYLKTASGGKK